MIRNPVSTHMFLPLCVNLRNGEETPHGSLQIADSFAAQGAHFSSCFMDDSPGTSLLTLYYVHLCTPCPEFLQHRVDMFGRVPLSSVHESWIDGDMLRNTRRPGSHY